MKTTRRGFLKCIAAIGTGIAIPDFRLVIPTFEIPKDLTWFSSAREIIQYDSIYDEYMIRHDIMGTEMQLFVHTICDSDRVKNHIEIVRQNAADKLAEFMREEGMSLRELRPLPMPHGYKNPLEIT